jgi:hypothetical protein
MAGDERVRHCAACDLNVYNVARMTRDEIRDLLVRTEGRLCVRLYRRSDGTLLTSDCPSGLRRLQRRVSRWTAAAVAALVTVSSWATGCASDRSRIRLDVEQVTIPQQPAFTGVVRDETGNPIPGVTVVLRDEVLQRAFEAVTDVHGAFTIASLNEGTYRVEATLDGLTPAVLKHVSVHRNEVTRVQVTLAVELTESITVGAISVDPLMMNDGISTTFTQDFVNKLPI